MYEASMSLSNRIIAINLVTFKSKLKEYITYIQNMNGKVKIQCKTHTIDMILEALHIYYICHVCFEMFKNGACKITTNIRSCNVAMDKIVNSLKHKYE